MNLDIILTYIQISRSISHQTNFVQLHIYQGDACSQRYYYQICLIVMTTFTAQSKDKNRYQGIGP